MKDKLNNEVLADHETQRLKKQNLSTLMQALCGCRKNCQECREEEVEWEPKIIQKEAHV